uniref:Epoxide hydrolase n=1 Tax=Esox lucius TaxID=8010 RepID=A0A3P9A0G0_ESOLU
TYEDWLLTCCYQAYRGRKTQNIPMGDGWWGPGHKPHSEDEKVLPFEVQTSDSEIQDLYDLIDRTRYTEPLENAGFQYGFNSTYLKKVVHYWRHKFDWKNQVAVLNKYPHFKTKIEGLDIHFVRVRPPHREGQRVLPLMLVHGWPGSFYEFYRILPLLTNPRGGLAFEVICPSIPGYGFSEAPHKQGFNSLAAARVFHKLMERLGFSEYYLQGGDWGSLITTNMAQMKPQCVKGLHLNMLTGRTMGFGVLFAVMFGRYLPWLFGFTREDVKRLFGSDGFLERNVYELLRESGYMHIQATKPDTAGCGVNNSPVGLAAYILEKFSTWTDFSNRDLEEGGLERKFTLDDLLTNVMIYWTSGSVVSSMRFYKENIGSNRPDHKAAVHVPTGLAAFPNEIMHVPQVWARDRYRNLYSYSYMPRGGHFAAFEEPLLLADDLRQFVEKVEKSSG